MTTVKPTPLLQSIRLRILILVLCPMFLMASVLLGMLYYWTTESGYRHLLMKVSTDLAVADQSFRNTQQNYLTELSLLAQSLQFRKIYLDSNPLLPKTPLKAKALTSQLKKLQQLSKLDFIQLLSINGCQLLQPQDCSGSASPLFKQAINGQAVSGVEVFSNIQLQKFSSALANRAIVTLIATEKAKPSAKMVEDRGMILHLVYPLADQQGKVQALLSAGVLMNGNATLVDQIKTTVYSDLSLAHDSVGTVTIFLQDVRISTNVPALEKPEDRALGSRVSEQVREKVLVQGKRWIDRAFVVSDWYISGYLPITDVYNQRIGMIYAGFLEAPFKRDFYRWMWQLLLIFVVIVTVFGLLVVLGAKGIFKPIETMVTVINNVRNGHRQRIILPAKTSDELLTLSLEFNLMLDQLERQHDHIQDSADQLEVKVSQRTKALNQHIKLLQNTREQLIAREKLAAIGELTAGIAHEINNPTAVILGYLDLMMSELGEAGEKVSDEVELIVQQVERIRSIINDLLQFSRPTESTSELKNLSINDVIESTIVLIKHDLNAKNIRLTLDLKASTVICSNRQQMQQVIINLLTNAIAASRTQGRIIIRSRNWRQQGVLISVKDNGYGIAAEYLQRIFDPFFSKTPGGTGLGLAVSYSILQGLDARIAVKSRPEIGSQFYIWLPTNTSQLAATPFKIK